MINTEQEIDDVMSQWMRTKRFTANPKVNALIRQRVEQYLENGGFVAQAHFERAYLSLLNEDAIQPFRGSISEQPPAALAISPDVIAFITSPRTTASELRHRYYTDNTFRTQYDVYEKTKSQTISVALSVEDYRKMPAAIVAQNYHRDHPRGFRASVDALISKGLI